MKKFGGALHDSRDLKRAANDVTGALAPLFVIVGESIPADVHILDYLGRSIGLDAIMAQRTRGSRDAYALDRAWLHFKPIVAAKPRGPTWCVRSIQPFAKPVTAFTIGTWTRAGPARPRLEMPSTQLKASIK